MSLYFRQKDEGDEMLLETATCKYNIVETHYVELTQIATNQKERILVKDFIGLIKNIQEKGQAETLLESGKKLIFNSSYHLRSNQHRINTYLTKGKDKELLGLLEKYLINHNVGQDSHMVKKASKVSNEDLPWNV